MEDYFDLFANVVCPIPSAPIIPAVTGGSDISRTEIRDESYREHNASKKLGRQAAAVYGYICEHPNSTRYEIAEYLGMLHTSVCGRIAELCDKGLIEPSGFKDGHYGYRNSSYSKVKTLL